MRKYYWVAIIVLLLASSAFYFNEVDDQPPPQVVPQETSTSDYAPPPPPPQPPEIVAIRPVEDEVQRAPQANIQEALFPGAEINALSIAGRVLNDAGLPIPGATVIAMPVGRLNGPTTFAESGPTGDYKVGVGHDGIYIIQASAPLKTTARVDEVRAGSRGVDLVMSDTGAIEGQVVDAETGLALTSFEIADQPGHHITPATWLRLRPRQDRNGRFRVENVESGDATLFVQAHGYVLSFTHLTAIPVGDTLRGIRIALEPSSDLDGLVLAPDGAPAPDAMIFVAEGATQDFSNTNMKAVSDKKGEFTLDGLVEEEHTLLARHDLLGTGTVRVVPGGKPITIQLAGGGALEGVVRVEGIARPGARVALAYRAPRFLTSTTTDESGRYAFSALMPGELELLAIVDHEQHARERRIDTTIRADEVTRIDVDFPNADASLTGAIYGVGMEPADATVKLIAAYDSGPEAFQVPRAQGHYEFKYVPPGAAVLELRDGPKLLRRIPLMLPEDQMTVRDVFLETGLSVMCQIDLNAPGVSRVGVFALHGDRLSTGEPHLDMRTLESEAAQYRYVQPGATLELRELEAGTYTIVARASIDEVPANEPRGAADIFDSQVVTVGEDQQRAEVALHLQPPW